MARTKQRVLDDHRSSQEAAANARAARRRAGIRKAARVLSSQEVAALPPVKYPARAPSETEDDLMPEADDMRRVRNAPCATHAGSGTHPPIDCVVVPIFRRQVLSLGCGARASTGAGAPAASGCAYGSRRRPQAVGAASGASTASSRTTTAPRSFSRQATARGLGSRSHRRRARCGPRSSRPPPRSRSSTHGSVRGCVSDATRARMLGVAKTVGKV